MLWRNANAYLFSIYTFWQNKLHDLAKITEETDSF